MPSILIEEFDTWRPGYGLATVRVLQAGTSVLAEIFTDEDLTLAADNPQTLSERVTGEISYGRFAQPLYVGVSYELEINSVDRTGVQRVSLTTLDGEDASNALVRVTDGEEDIALADHLARRIDIENYGDFIAVGGVGASAATNTATITNAVGVAGARGAAFVDLPAGTYAYEAFTLPAGVVLRGQGRGATILQCVQAANTVTIGGVRAGFSRLTLDGVTLVALSVGVYAENKDQIVFDDVEIKRFETGLYRKGGKSANWRELYLSNCVTGYKGYGDAASGNGGELGSNRWTGGTVDTCSTAGVDFKNVDEQCSQQVISGVTFDDNTGTAVKLTGTRAIELRDAIFTGNTKNIVAADGSPATADNTVIGLEVVGGAMTDGTLELTGALEAVALRRVTLQDVAITLTTPLNNILVEDCREVSGMTFAGVATAWTRNKTGDIGTSSGLTTGNTATKAWAITLDYGQAVYLEAKVIGRQRNSGDFATYHFVANGGRSGATLNYDTQTANFTQGDVVTGGTSGATARLAVDTDAGATGAMTLYDVSGTFVDNEIITGAVGGSATVNGALVAGSCVVNAVTNLLTPQETDSAWAATFIANGPEIELRVTGNTGDTVEWTVEVDVLSI